MGAQRLLGVVLVLSVAARIAVALYLGDTEKAPPLLMDQLSYHALGQRIVEGKGYSFAQGWYPFTMPDTPTAHWSFAYPLFVAALYSLFGVHPLAVRLVQSILGGLLLPWLVYRLARRAVPERPRIALIAAGVAAVYGYFVLYAAALMTETFFIALLLWAMEASLRVEAALRERRVPPVVPVLEIGLSLGLATLMRLGARAVPLVALARPSSRSAARRRVSFRVGRRHHLCAHRPVDLSQLPGLWRIPVAQFQHGVCHVLGAAPDARDEL